MTNRNIIFNFAALQSSIHATYADLNLLVTEKKLLMQITYVLRSIRYAVYQILCGQLFL